MWSLLEERQGAEAGSGTGKSQSPVCVMSWNYKPCESGDERGAERAVVVSMGGLTFLSLKFSIGKQNPMFLANDMSVPPDHLEWSLGLYYFGLFFCFKVSYLKCQARHPETG